MNVLVVSGSPRKKDSYLICMEIGNELKKYDSTIDFEYLQLSESHIEECKGCGICFQKSELLCPCRKDEIEKIKEKMKEADAIIISSPVYAYQVTGQMKKFIDRLSYLFHRQELCGKPVIIVVTTDGGGSKQVYKYLKMTVSGWAMDLVGDVQIISPAYFEYREPKGVFKFNKRTYMKGQLRIKTLAKKLYEKMGRCNKIVPTYYDIFLFNCLRSKIYTSDADRVYWRDKGWIDASYFYDADINLVKRVFGKIMKMLIDFLGKKISSGI